MGFFSILRGLFGKGGPKEARIETARAAVFLEGELAPKKKQLLEEAAKRLAEIRHLLRETRASLKHLDDAELAARSGRIDRIVSTAKSNALKQLFPLLEKLGPPNTEGIGEIRRYCSESIIALQQAGTFGKNIAYAGISFKDEMKLVGESMKQISAAFIALDKAFEENKAVFSQALLGEQLALLEESRQRVSLARERIQSLEKKAGELSAKKSRIESDLEALKQGKDFANINSLNEKKAGLFREKQAAKTELLDIFAKVEKPLHRLDKAVAAGKVFLPEAEAHFLRQLLLNPVQALRLDPTAKQLKKVLLETKKAVESGLIDLKPKEREKKVAVLEELLAFDFFSESFWKLNKIDAELLSIERQLGDQPAMQEEKGVVGEMKQATEELARTAEETGIAKSEMEKENAGIAALRLSMQALLSKATGKNVLLKD